MNDHDRNLHDVPGTARSRCLLLSTLIVLSCLSTPTLAQAFGGMDPLPTVAGVPFYPNVFGAAAEDAESSRESRTKRVPGMPLDVYVDHVSVVMWSDKNGEPRYAATLALHSIVFTMSIEKCMTQNGGDREACKMVYDAAAPVLAVAKASDGGYFFATAGKRSDARKKAIAACEHRPNVTCTLDKVYGSGGGLFDR